VSVICTVHFSKRVGVTVRELRLERGLSQLQLADMIGYERSRIGRLELGDTAISVDTLLAIANALEVSIYSLLPIDIKLKSEPVTPEQFKCQSASSVMTLNPSESKAAP
jgi:transcriptional regulator with XRE-family HTH domain